MCRLTLIVSPSKTRQKTIYYLELRNPAQNSLFGTNTAQSLFKADKSYICAKLLGVFQVIPLQKEVFVVCF